MAKEKNTASGQDAKQEKQKKNKATSGGGKDTNTGGLEGKMAEGKGNTSGSRGTGSAR